MKLKISFIRIEKKISARELARSSGVSRSYLQLLEGEKPPKPSVYTMYRLAKALEVEMEELVEEVEDPKKDETNKSDA